MVSSSEPTIGKEDRNAICISCAGRRFRRSRLQLKDLIALLSLQYPVRCLSCSRRQSVAFAVARRSVPSSVKQVRAPRHDETPWNTPVTLNAAAVDPSVGLLALPRREPVTMPNLRGIKLPHVAYVPPGDGENLAS